MKPRVLVTGAAGLIGSALSRALLGAGYEIAELDVRARAPAARGDVRDADALARSLDGCAGVVHLAAVSRVVWGERDPAACWSVNVDGTHAVVAAAHERRQWILFASSREVYGPATHLPATEETPVAPINVYGRSKVAGEQLVAEASARGLVTGIVRLSNVYGTTTDHQDRVVPAFARAATNGAPLRVDGATHTFDFTHIDDVVRGIAAAVCALDSGESLPTIHFVSGVPTTLRELAELAVKLANTDSPIIAGPERTYDVARFYGSAERARSLLGWEPRVSLAEGLRRLVDEFRRGANPGAEVAS